MSDYRSHPKVRDNGDGTWTVAPGYDGKAWTITHIAHLGEHYGATRVGQDPADWMFVGSFDEVAFNVIGWEI